MKIQLNAPETFMNKNPFPSFLTRSALIGCAMLFAAIGTVAHAQEAENITALLREDARELTTSDNIVFSSEYLTIDSRGSANVQNSAFISHAFDGDPSTTKDRWSSQWVINGKPAIFTYTISEDWWPGREIILSSYRVYYAGADRPGTWTLSGSNDGETWTELSSRSGSWTGDYLDVEIEESLRASYRAYKFHCTANADTGGWVRFAEVEFFGNILSPGGMVTVSASAGDDCEFIGITTNGIPIAADGLVKRDAEVVVSMNHAAGKRIDWGRVPKGAVAGHDPQTGYSTLTFVAGRNVSISAVAIDSTMEDIFLTPGLLGGYLDGQTGLAIGTYPAEESVFLSPETGASSLSPAWGQNRTWVYHGQMYFPRNGVYWFGENIDDAAWLQIDGKVILNDSVYNQTTYGYVLVENAPCRLDFEARFYNATGAAGPVVGNGWTNDKGFGYSFIPDLSATSSSRHGDGTTFTFPIDPGDGSIFSFRSEDGTLAGGTAPIVVEGNPGRYGEVLPAYGASADYADGTSYLFRALKSVWTNEEETIAARLSGYSRYVVDYVNDETGPVETVSDGTATATVTPEEGVVSFLVWNWDSEYKVTTAFADDLNYGNTLKIYANGVLVPNGSFVPHGTQIRIVAEGNDDYRTFGWSGTLAPGVDVSQSELSFVLSQPIHAIAHLISSGPEAGLTRYVSPIFGNDDNTGISPILPKASIESAYEAVSETIEEIGGEAKGVIRIMEGTTVLSGTEHALGEKGYCWLDLDKPVTIEGYGASRDKCVIMANENNAYRMHFRISNPDVVIRGVTLTGGRFGYDNDQADYGAGSIFMDCGVVSNCVIHSNIGGKAGSPGAVRMVNNSVNYPILSDCVITNNLCGGAGACGHGVLIKDGTASATGISALVERCFFDNNRDGGTGYNFSSGTISIRGNSSRGAVVRDSVITRDSSHYGNGAGVVMEAGLVERCVITNNITTDKSGAGVYITGGALANCYIANNRAKSSGGGIYAGGGFIINNTVVSNETSDDDQSGIYVTGNSVILLNNISCNNKESSGSPKRNISFASTAGSGKYIDYNCFVPAESLDIVKAGVAGAHNYLTNPLLKDVASQAGYELLSSSPCIDTAATPETMESTGYITTEQMLSSPLCNADFFTDIVHMTRPKHGNPSLDGGIDIGAYEAPSFMEGDFRIAFSSDIQTAQQFLDADNVNTNENPVTVTFTPLVGGIDLDDSENEITLTWSATDEYGKRINLGETSPSDENKGVLVAHFPVGRYDIAVSAYNAKNGESISFALENCVSVSAPWAFVSTTGNSIFPYYRLEDAARYVDEAVVALCPSEDAQNGTKSAVYVAEGEYNVRGINISIGIPITVKSLSGPEKTALVAHGANDPATQPKTTARRIVVVNDSDAVLDGFTLKGATGHDVGGVMLYDGMITNCIICDNTKPAGGAAGLYMKGGLLVDSVLRNNTAPYKWDSAHALTIAGGIVSSCLITNNATGSGNGSINGIVSMDGGTLTNCVISGNHAAMNWDGYYGALYIHNANAKAINCVIANNYNNRIDANMKASGVYITAGLLRQCLITGNTAEANAVGTVGLNQAGGTVESCTIADNGLDSPNATGAYMNKGTALNNIYYNNGASGSLALSASGFEGNISYCCFAEATEAPFNGEDAHNIAQRPRLNKNYTLGGRTPCRSKGLAQPWMEGAYDLTGNPFLGIAPVMRIRSGTPEIGCYEVTTSGPSVLIMK